MPTHTMKCVSYPRKVMARFETALVHVQLPPMSL